MKSLVFALILTIPLTCYAGQWSQVIASTIVTVEAHNQNVVCQNGVCFIRRERAIVVNSSPVQTVKASTRVVYRQRVFKRQYRVRRFFQRRRCCS